MVNKLLILLVLTLPTLAADDYELYKKARQYWYDQNWSEAAATYKTLLEQYPNSKRRCKAESNLAYCYKSMGQLEDAFKVLTKSVASGLCSEDELVDIRSERVNLAFTLMAKDPAKKKVLVEALTDKNKEIRFLAALKLAELGDKSGVPVFMSAVEEETDQDMREMAINHIVKYGSQKDKDNLQKLLNAYKQENKGKKAKMFRLIIRNLETGKTETKVNLPIGLVQELLAMLNQAQLDVIKTEAKIDVSNLSKYKYEEMAPGTVIFKVVNRADKTEIKLFLE